MHGRFVAWHCGVEKFSKWMLLHSSFLYQKSNPYFFSHLNHSFNCGSEKDTIHKSGWFFKLLSKTKQSDVIVLSLCQHNIQISFYDWFRNGSNQCSINISFWINECHMLNGIDPLMNSQSTFMSPSIMTKLNILAWLLSIASNISAMDWLFVHTKEPKSLTYCCLVGDPNQCNGCRLWLHGS